LPSFSPLVTRHFPLSPDAPVPTKTAIAITIEAKHFTGEIVKGLEDIGISLFFYVGRVLRGPKPKSNKQTGL